MSEAPLAPKCRHCGATNDSGASECWLCHQGDWRETPKAPSKPLATLRRTIAPQSRFIGCMAIIALSLMGAVGIRPSRSVWSSA